MGMIEWAALLGNFGEFVGSIGVIASLFYLAVQIRANTATTRATASFDAVHSWAQLNENISVQPESYHATILALTDTQTSPDDLSDVQWQQMTMLNRAVMQKLEGQFYLFKYGLMEPDIWSKRSSVGRGWIDPPLQKSWWASEKAKQTFTEEFVAAIEGAENLAVPGTLINRPPARDG